MEQNVERIMWAIVAIIVVVALMAASTGALETMINTLYGQMSAFLSDAPEIIEP